MSQHDFQIANQGFPSFRSDLNSGLQALASNSAGATEPSSTYAYQFWYDSTANLLKMRNTDDDAWITLAYFDQTNDEWEVRSAVIQAVDSAGVVIKTDDGNTRLTIGDDGTVTVDGTLDVDTIAEKTGDAGVTIEGITIKDSAVGTIASPAALISDSLNGGQFGGRRNLIINGAMQVAQRGTSSTGVTSSEFFVDRWRYETLGEETVTLTQSTDAPDGFANSFKVETTTADASLSAGDYAVCRQGIEAQNLQHLKYGTASAQSFIVSFWVKSSVTGTYAVGVEHGETASYYSDTFTISSADTWENHSVVVLGNTATAINNDNGRGFTVNFFLSAGSNYTTGSNGAWGAIANWAAGQSADIIGTLNATWYITGVQLEVGSVATPFEHRSYGEELAACQRYFQKLYSETTFGYPCLLVAEATSATQAYGAPQFITPMRAAPTFTYTGNFRITTQSAAVALNGITWDSNRAGVLSGEFSLTTASGLTAGRTYLLQNNNDSSAAIFFSAEL